MFSSCCYDYRCVVKKNKNYTLNKHIRSGCQERAMGPGAEAGRPDEGGGEQQMGPSY